ncbi:MAG: recombinase family protein [Lentilitoribacter sp.]
MMPQLQNNKKALIYSRVSTKKQTQGTGLQSQEHRCREHAERLGLDVEAVFPDDVSGGGDFMKRPGMVALLAYLDAQSGGEYVVIFDDLKRFARDTEFHLKLRKELSARNATVECPNFKFEDTPEGKFIETVFAAHGELEREQNRRQIIQKMKARVEQGFWVFQAPVGFAYEKSKSGGKILVRDEPLASIVQEAIEGFAIGRFQSQVEVQRFLEAQPAFPKDLPNGKIRAFKITRLLTKPVYAGYVHSEKWNISMREGRHEGLVSKRTFERVQDRLNATGLAPARKDIREDFILRGFVQCADCGGALTSCWSKSKTGRHHPYYRCYDKSCAQYGKSIRRDDMEGQFVDILKSMQPRDSLKNNIAKLFRMAWDMRLAQSKDHLKRMQDGLKDIDKQIEQFLVRIVETTNPSVIQAYETKIANLEQDKLIQVEKLKNHHQPRHSFEHFLNSPSTSCQTLGKYGILAICICGKQCYDWPLKSGYTTNAMKAF